MFSCKKTEEIISFESIELSYRNGFTASRETILIKKDGSVINFHKGYPFDSSFYFKDTLSLTELNLLSKQVSDLITTKIDTTYGEDCPDYSSRFIIIKSKSKTLQSKIYTIDSSIKNRLVTFCDSIYTNKNMVKLIEQNKFDYKSRISKELYFKSSEQLISKFKRSKQ